MRFLPSSLIGLDGAVRDQDLKGVQIRGLTKKMLDDVGNLLAYSPKDCVRIETRPFLSQTPSRCPAQKWGLCAVKIAIMMGAGPLNKSGNLKIPGFGVSWNPATS